MRYYVLTILLLTANCLQAFGKDDRLSGVIIDQQHRNVLMQHCQTCHGSETAEAAFRVDDLPAQIDTLEVAARWQKVLNALNSGEMPPEGEKQLEKVVKADFLDHLANVMVDARKRFADQQGVVTMRRLNRREYRNTLRELLGVEINVNELPPDGGAGRFDTSGADLYVSSTQLEQYLALGREALNEAFEWEAAAGVEKKLRFEAEEITEKVAKHIEDQIDAEDRGRRWTKLVDDAVALPENQSIVAEIRAGPLGNHKDIFYRYWKKFPGVAAPESFGFKTVENNADKAVAALKPFHLPYHRYYLEQPEVKTGAYLAIPNEHPAVLDNATINLLVPFSWPVGNYIVRFRAAVTQDATPERQFIEFGLNPRIQQAMSSHHITGTMESPQVVEIPLTMTRGNLDRANRSMFLREVGTRDSWDQATYKAAQGRKENHGIGRTFALWVDWMEIERIPTHSSSPGLLAIKSIPFDDKAALPANDVIRASLKSFCIEAFRGNPPSEKFVDQLVELYHAQRQLGAKHTDALKDTLSVVLTSPMFLYLAEESDSTQSRDLSGRELAVRLSYFLWSAPPDKTLRDLGENGDLLKPEVLSAQADRLMNDPRSQEFVHALTHQWLGLERLDFFQVNQQKHPRFDNATRLAARQEIYETVSYLFQHNEPINHLLKADYVIVNGLLANFYGIEGVTGDEFQKVSIPSSSPRGGLLGMSAVHLMGSNGDVSNPVERGAWVLRKLLHDPPPPAPANVPQLARLAGMVLTTRERVVAHQEEPQCASCHRKIDPIGFGLENFDAVGIWRTEDTFIPQDDNGKPDNKRELTWTIDPSARLHLGPSFQTFQQLRDIIATHQDDFATGYTEALISYGLGRPAGFSDQELIDSILKHGRNNDYAIRSYISALIESPDFRRK